MRYRTRNSIWEVDWSTNRVRRLSGTAPTTPRTPEEGTWRLAKVIVDLPDDAGLWFDWEGDGRGTWTSMIMERQAVHPEGYVIQ